MARYFSHCIVIKPHHIPVNWPLSFKHRRGTGHAQRLFLTEAGAEVETPKGCFPLLLCVHLFPVWQCLHPPSAQVLNLFLSHYLGHMRINLLIPTLQGPCNWSQKWRGTLRFLPPIKMRPSFISSNLAESREAPLTPQYPSPLRGTWKVP